MEQEQQIQGSISPWTMTLHTLTLLLIYAYIKEQLVFSFLWVLTPSLLVFAAQGYHLLKMHKGVQRGKYMIVITILFCFLLCLGKVVKNEGGVAGDQFDGDKWLVKHRKCFGLVIVAMMCYTFYTFIDSKHKAADSVVK